MQRVTTVEVVRYISLRRFGVGIDFTPDWMHERETESVEHMFPAPRVSPFITVEAHYGAIRSTQGFPIASSWLPAISMTIFTPLSATTTSFTDEEFSNVKP